MTANGKSADEVAADARLNTAIREIEVADSLAHFLDLDIEGKPTQPISLRRLRAALRGWIETLPDGDAARGVAPLVFEEFGLGSRYPQFPDDNDETNQSERSES